jgi:2'-5' RNA ligase
VRAFLAFDLDAPFVESAAAFAGRLRDRAGKRRLRWCAPGTMHVTARFFGDVEDPAPLVALVPMLVRPAPIVRAAKLDAFPDLRRARVLVLAIEDDGTLAAIAAEAEKAAVALGFEPEQRAYRPHLTLARLKEPSDLRDLAEPISLSGRAVALTLYESKTTKEGPVYTSLVRSALQ